MMQQQHTRLHWNGEFTYLHEKRENVRGQQYLIFPTSADNSNLKYFLIATPPTLHLLF